MTIIIKIAVFLLGIYLSMRTIAALYGIADYRYTIKTAYPKVIGRILCWGIITLLMATLLGRYRYPFLWGMPAYIAVCILSYLPNKLMLMKEVRSVDMQAVDSRQ